MKHGTPFRAAALFAMAMAAIANTFAPGSSGRQAALAGLAPYQGRGKGRSARHNQGGTRAYQRAATKARNIKRYKAQCKGSK